MPSGSGILGNTNTWTELTSLTSVTLDPDGTAAGPTNNYGWQSVIADPSNPGHIYASATYQGIWKTTNYGATWNLVVPSGSDPAMNGRSALAFAPDGSYLLATALYPINSYSNGCWKSTDKGLTWTRNNVGAPNGDDIGGIAILSTDKTKVIAVSHSSPYDVFESSDSGQTFTNRGPAGTSAAGAADVIWLDSTHLLAIGAGDNASGDGTWLGTWGGSSWSWSSVDTQQHWHGASQIYQNGSTIITGGGFGVRKSTNSGASFTQVDANNSASLVATASYLYSTTSYALNSGSFGPNLMRAPLPSGSAFSAMTAPGWMVNGALSSCAVTDGSKWAVFMACWCAGLGMYVE